MKDLIIGFVVGALVVSGIFFYANGIRKIEKMEMKQEIIISDIERITHKIGGLPEKVRKK